MHWSPSLTEALHELSKHMKHAPYGVSLRHSIQQLNIQANRPLSILLTSEERQQAAQLINALLGESCLPNTSSITDTPIYLQYNTEAQLHAVYKDDVTESFPLSWFHMLLEKNNELSDRLQQEIKAIKLSLPIDLLKYAQLILGSTTCVPHLQYDAVIRIGSDIHLDTIKPTLTVLALEEESKEDGIKTNWMGALEAKLNNEDEQLKQTNFIAVEKKLNEWMDTEQLRVSSLYQELGQFLYTLYLVLLHEAKSLPLTAYDTYASSFIDEDLPAFQRTHKEVQEELEIIEEDLQSVQAFQHIDIMDWNTLELWHEDVIHTLGQLHTQKDEARESIVSELSMKKEELINLKKAYETKRTAYEEAKQEAEHTGTEMVELWQGIKYRRLFGRKQVKTFLKQEEQHLDALDSAHVRYKYAQIASEDWHHALESFTESVNHALMSTQGSLLDRHRALLEHQNEALLEFQLHMPDIPTGQFQAIQDHVQTTSVLHSILERAFNFESEISQLPAYIEAYEQYSRLLQHIRRLYVIEDFGEQYLKAEALRVQPEMESKSLHASITPSIIVNHDVKKAVRFPEYDGQSLLDQLWKNQLTTIVSSAILIFLISALIYFYPLLLDLQ
ncbi:hypothetical protein [Pontibacillus halophilus]|uniref:hypothetical protein n=1 Tax=Pontibacillus halophilus TaxID=516704 RepID=UPI0012B62FC6|nr:hypothetical protein [Pontibacillus halophilus]